MRIVGIIAAYNEELLIAACLEHHIAQGIELYLLDNESSDRTVEIASGFLGRGLLGIETVPRHQGIFDLRRVLTRKQELAFSLDADWFIHLDADEMRLAPDGTQTLAQAIRVADSAGYNAVNFFEFTFVPTMESPFHEHARFQETMRWYYPFLRQSLHRVNGWKKQANPVDLGAKSGHVVRFSGQFIYPLPFRMRHYQFLSVNHAIRQYSGRRHPPEALALGKHGWREQLDPHSIRLPSESALHEINEDGGLDFSHPRSVHLFDNRAARQGPGIWNSDTLLDISGRRLLKALAMKIARRLKVKQLGT